MTLKTCDCGKVQTTTNAAYIGRTDELGIDALYFNCTSCWSTFTLVTKADQAQLLAWKVSMELLQALQTEWVD